MELLGLLSGLLAIAVAVAAYIQTRKTDQTNIDLQRRVTDIEVARRNEEVARANQANLRAEIQSPPDIRTDLLVVTNTGEAIAEEVELESFVSRRNGEPVTTLNSPFPVASIHPSDSVTCPFVTTWGVPSPFLVTISWIDPRGRQTKTQTLTRIRD